MSKFSIAAIIRYLRGKREKNENTDENEENAASTPDLDQRLGNHGLNQYLNGNPPTGVSPENAGEIQKTDAGEIEEADAGEVQEADAGEVQETNAGEIQETNAGETPQQTDAGNQQKSIRELYDKLKTSRRGGFHLGSGNSSYYNKVKASMDDILESMTQGFSSNQAEENLRQFEDMQEKYQQLIANCEAYVSRSTLTANGEARKGIVQELLNAAKRDLIGLNGMHMEFESLPPNEQKTKTWDGIIDRIRTKHLYADDLFQEEKEAKGGASSEVIALKTGDLKVNREDGTAGQISKTYYFKPEDEIEVGAKTYESKIINSVLARYPDLPEEEKEKFYKWAEAGEFPEHPEGLSAEGERALRTLKENTARVKVMYKQMIEPSGIASEGGKVNMTRRNVATCRIASLLGLENLVAKSYTAEVHDEKTNQTIRGNMMEKAEGISTGDYRAKRIKAVAEREKREKNPGSTENIKSTYDVGNPDEVGKTAPTAVGRLVQRDLLNLQVLDVLCGQMDRHMDNVMVQVENNTVTGIKGIDNDGSFGLNTDVVSSKRRERHDRRIFDPKSKEMLIPYMDKKLAERILNLDPSVVKFSLKGLITDQEIKAFLQRLDRMKDGIKKAKKTPNRFLNDDEWNQETAQRIFEDGWRANFSLEKEKEAEILERIGRIDPSLKGLRRIDVLKEKKYLWKQEEEKLEDPYYQKKIGLDNYFGKMLITTMADKNAQGVPQIQIR